MGSNFRGRSFLLVSFSVVVTGLVVAVGCSHDDPGTTPAPPTAPKTQAAAPAPVKVEPKNQAKQSESAAKIAKVDESTAEGNQLDVSELVKRYDNAVVFITTYDVLGDKTGSGTGCVISSDGLVATSHHVLADAATAQAQLKDGETITLSGYRAADLDHDLAIVQLEHCPADLEHFELTEPVIAQGDPVIAIGHPQEFKFTVTEGIISAVREAGEIEGLTEEDEKSAADTTWVQTTAAISGGSSGSPLITRRGELIGVNTWRASGQSLGFAIHVKHLRELNDSLDALQPLPLPGTNVIRDVAVARLWRDFMREYAVLLENLRATPEGQHEAVIARQNPVPIYLQKLHDHAVSSANTPAAIDALATACRISSDTRPKSIAVLRKILSLLESEYMEDKRMSDVASALSSAPPLESVQQLLRNVAERSPHSEAQGSACMALITVLSRAAATNPSGHRQEIVVLLERCASEFRDQHYKGQKISSFIDDLLFEKKHLEISCRAPDIEGTDHEGKPFSLTEYAGKVTVLDFWADWCPHCRIMYPHEREMVERFKDQPFVLLGVNADDPVRARQVIERGDVTWRSWLDGPGGPIITRWQVTSYPTIFVLDRHGIIRVTGVRGEELEQAVVHLLEEPKLDMPADLIKPRSQWAYQLTTDPPPSDWNAVGFEDADWPRATAPVGYGHTLVESPLDVPHHNQSRPVTSHFRRVVEVPDVAAVKNLFLELWADDGAIIYLNGQEALRVNLPRSAGPTTVALEPAYRDGRRKYFRLDPTLLASGRNVIAVEVHQDRPTSPDLLFDLSLSTSLPDSDAIFSSELTQIQARYCRMLAEIGAPAAELAAELAAHVKPLVRHKDGTLRIEAQVALARLDPEWKPIPTTWFTNAAEKQLRRTKASQFNNRWWTVVASSDRTPRQLATALQFLEIACQFLSDDGPLTNSLGVAQLRNGQFTEAVTTLNKSLALQGDNPIDLASLVICYTELDKSDEAQDAWDKLEKLLQDEQDTYAGNDEVQAFYAEAKQAAGR